MPMFRIVWLLRNLSLGGKMAKTVQKWGQHDILTRGRHDPECSVYGSGALDLCLPVCSDK